jgi:hypothetical protein
MKISERRKEPRYLCFGQVKLNRLPGAILPGRIIDLSLGGCLIAMQRPAPVSQGSVVELTIQTRGTALRMIGIITFLGRQAPRWMGISFKKMSKRGELQLMEIIAELEAIPAPDRNLCLPKKSGAFDVTTAPPITVSDL